MQDMKCGKPHRRLRRGSSEGPTTANKPAEGSGVCVTIPLNGHQVSSCQLTQVGALR